MKRLILALLLAACDSRPGADRAVRDTEIGRATSQTATVAVENGLGLVRTFDARAVEVWAQAPAIELVFDLPPDRSGTWTLIVTNAMPGAVLTLPDGSIVTPTDRPIPTEAHFAFPLAAGRTKISIAPTDVAGAAPFRFIAMADVQDALPFVGDVWKAINRRPDARFVVFAGDLTERGTESELLEFRERARELAVPLFSTIGNHELISGTPENPLPGEISYQRIFGRANTHFAFHGVHFSLVDSADGTLDPAVLETLDGWLAASRDAVHVFATHIPLFEPSGSRSGSFGSRQEAASIVERLVQAKVDLLLYGHVHSFYGFSNGGIPAYISGGGGAIPEKFDGVGRHFLDVAVDAKSGVGDVALVRIDTDDELEALMSTLP